MDRRLVVLVTGALALAACKEEEPPPEPPPVQAVERPAVLGPRPLASRVAYDLVLVGDGAVLVWGPPADQGGGIRAARLDAFGTRAGDEARVYEPPGGSADRTYAPSVLELSAAAAGGKIAVLWVERDGVDLPVRAQVGDAESLAFGAARGIEAGVVRGMSYRGHVGVAGSPDGSFVGIYRGQDRPCQEGASTTCAGFGVRPIRAGDVGESRVPLAVPSPCQRSIAGIVSTGDRVHYGVCSEDGGSAATTVYTIQQDPEYARSDTVLEGCAPVGALLEGDATWVVGQCGDDRRLARFATSTEPPTVLAMKNEPIRCEDGRPVIPVADGLDVTLTGPRDHLEPLLPKTLTELGARAVWTGRSMILAVALAREVAIHRYECEDGRFQRTDIL